MCFFISEGVTVETIENEQRHPAERGKMRAKPANILYVDDETPVLEMIRMSLERMGHVVLTLNDPGEALDLFKKDPTRFDLVITDHSMPEMNGDRLAEKLLEIRPDIPIIMCTGTNDLDWQQVSALGVRAYLEKPVERARMAETIRKAMTQPPPAPASDPWAAAG